MQDAGCKMQDTGYKMQDAITLKFVALNQLADKILKMLDLKRAWYLQ